MNTERLIKFITEHGDLSPELITDLEGRLKEEYYKTHQILHAAGQQENRIYFLEKGLIRNYYYDHHGNEHTVKFWEANDILFSYQGYYAVPSYFYTEIIEASTLITLSYTSLRELDTKYPETTGLIKNMLLRYQHEEYEIQKLIALPPEERYITLRTKRPNLFKKVPARIIASYLHLTRETLTRYISRN
ncbi:Crp/Fnr family transcriptional regulator [Mucilaginibacter sp.]|jgi:CRP-like cAMP-binding protein|uniref:Crp/Fnr family transcriptional regulator n=1 Tax=Mucilaginibacter sp. TaxID=1882438 RepID=UPI0035662F70